RPRLAAPISKSFTGRVSQNFRRRPMSVPPTACVMDASGWERPVQEPRRDVMEYLFLITVDESQMPTRDTATPDSGSDGMAAWLAYNQRLIDGGHWVGGASLQPSESTTTLKLGEGGVSATTDGPYTETKEKGGRLYPGTRS